MKLDSLVRLIESADYMSFREIALLSLQARGFHEAALTDGWKDGGTDVRIFQIPPNPLRGYPKTSERVLEIKTTNAVIPAKAGSRSHRR